MNPSFSFPIPAQGRLSRLCKSLLSICVPAKPKRNPWHEAMADFDERIAFARRHNLPVIHIQAERRRFVESALRGGK